MVMFDYLIWFLFSVILALLHLFVALIVSCAVGCGKRFTKVLVDGSLLFFAMSLTAGSCGQYFQDRTISSKADSVVFFLAVFMVVPITVLYTLVVRDRIVAARTSYRINDGFALSFSVGASIGAVLYGSALFLMANSLPMA